MYTKYLITFFISLLFILNSCKNTDSKEEINIAEDDHYTVLNMEQLNSGDIKLDSARLYKFNEFIDVSGTIEIPPYSQNMVTVLYPGRITGLNYIPGQYIKKGQPLFSIENPELIDLQQRYSALSEELVYLKDDFERQQKLFNENANSEKKFIKAESDYKSNLAELNGIKKKLEMLGVETSNFKDGNFKGKYQVLSPISGTIGEIFKLNGEYCTPSENILKIVNKQEAHLSLQVFENDIDKIKIGQKVQFTTPEGKTNFGKIHLISPTLDPDSKSLMVHADIDKLSEFYDNTYVTARIFTDEKDHLALPANSLLTEGEDNFILLLDKKDGENYYFIKFPITLTLKNEKYISFNNIDNLKNNLVITEGAILLQKDE